MRDEVLARLAHELASFRSPWEDGAQRARLITSALPRLAATLDLLPAATSASRLLELGAAPFIGSQCLDLLWPGGVAHANYYGSAERHGTQTLFEVGGSRTKTYSYDLFNIEIDEFPYPDQTFDVVIFSELIEHLAINPVWALAEMHRVLRSDGHLIVTTPNALSLERLDSVVRGRRPSVDQYSPSFGYGARHNREYSAIELQALLQETGFDVELIEARDLATFGPAIRAGRAILRAALRPFAATSRKEHLFLRARRGPVFRWRFSPLLFGDMTQLRILRHPWIEMGVNDTIQCEGAWGEVEELPDGGWMRMARGETGTTSGASGHLRGVAGRRRVVIQLRGAAGPTGSGAPVRFAVAGRDAVHEPIGLAWYVVPGDAWREIDIPLTRPATDGEELIVNLLPEPGSAVQVRRIALR